MERTPRRGIVALLVLALVSVLLVGAVRTSGVTSAAEGDRTTIEVAAPRTTGGASVARLALPAVLLATVLLLVRPTVARRHRTASSDIPPGRPRRSPASRRGPPR